MLQWTGEQFVPAIRDASIVYRHIHSYIYVSEFIKGRRVLDLAAGEGYGANLLAGTAAAVVGIVADEAIARYAAEKYKRANVEFRIASIPADEHSFDAVVRLDATEATADPNSYLLQAKRFLKLDGLFVLSLQNSDVQEARGLLTKHFKHVEIFGQRIYANSSIWPVVEPGAAAVREILMERNGADEFRAVGPVERVPTCLIAIASDSDVAVQRSGSVFIDQGNELLEDKEIAIRELTESKTYQAAALKAQDVQLAERRESLAFLQEAFAWHKSQIDSLTKTREYLESEIVHLRNTIGSNEEALSWRASQVADLEKSLAWHASRIESLESEVGLLRILAQTQEQELDNIKASRGWKFILQIRGIRDKLMRTFGRA